MGQMTRMFKSVVRHLRDSRGLSLYEITAAVAMAGIVAAVAVPVALERIADAQSTTAKMETETMFKAAFAFFDDTGLWPGEIEMRGGSAGGQDVTTKFLVSVPPGSVVGDVVLPGDGTGGGPFPTAGCGDCLNINDFLVNDPNTGSTTVKYPNWGGPYMDVVDEDPFGRAYIFNSRPLFDPEDLTVGNALGFGWIISAGADNTLTTALTDSDLSETTDDIGRSLGKKVIQQ